MVKNQLIKWKGGGLRDCCAASLLSTLRDSDKVGGYQVKVQQNDVEKLSHLMQGTTSFEFHWYSLLGNTHLGKTKCVQI